MATHTVTDDVLHSASAASYFTRADRRVMIGLRAALEMLNLPTPEYALRRDRGSTPARNVMTAYRADHPAQFATGLAPRKPNATPDAVAAARQRTALYLQDHQ